MAARLATILVGLTAALTVLGGVPAHAASGSDIYPDPLAPPSSSGGVAAGAVNDHQDPSAPAGEGHDGTDAGEHGEMPAMTDGVKAPASEPGAIQVDAIKDLEPYRLIRSLQVVQDAVVRGDHSAMEMQRYLLGIIDERLRAADQGVFDDPRNVDAALIYAMSGGNPATLDQLALQDKFGNFDNEVTTVLRAYLAGQGSKTKSTLTDLVDLYRDTEIGPYLALVAANVSAGMNETKSLKLFDWARLTSPGTLVEEAALRRSLFVAARQGMIDEAIGYAHLYARRFINSPYAGQYADLLVDLFVDNYGKVGDDKLAEVLSFMDTPRQREVYLRISRRAVIKGLRDLALFAAGKADSMADLSDPTPRALSDLYKGMVGVSTEGVIAARDSLNAVPEAELSARDKALRQAARLVADEVLRKPDPNSLTQAFSPRINKIPDDVPDIAQAPGIVPSGIKAEPDDGTTIAEASPQDAASRSVGARANPAADTEFSDYVAQHRQTLQEIDDLLEGKRGEGGT